MTESRIYESFDSATKRLSCFAVLDSGQYVARVIFRYAESGMRVTCYFQAWGSPMVKAYANGCGYDRCTAAINSALARACKASAADEARPEVQAIAERMRHAVKDDGMSWDSALIKAGFTVLSLLG